MPNKKELEASKTEAPPSSARPSAAEAVSGYHRVSPRASRRKGDVIVGNSGAIVEVHRLIDLAAPRDTDVLMTGENGTGKELVARTLHAQSPRSAGPFVVVDCGAIPPDFLENELFGQTRPGFSSSRSAQFGLIHAAHGGTLFLDEVGELSLGAQTKLLRFLQDREYRPVGSTRPVRADVRMLFATNRDLQRAVRQGEFRKDLYYRLSTLTIGLPGLRHRRLDIPLLVDHFVRTLRDDIGHNVERFSPEAMAVLMQRPWPGNVRELYNFTRTTVVLATERVIEPAHLWSPPEADTLPGDPLELGYAELRRRILAHFEADFVATVLKAAGGNISLAARLAKVDRKHLWRLMQRAGVAEPPEKQS
jgi:DNA-binding NtrC family response regulator